MEAGIGVLEAGIEDEEAFLEVEIETLSDLIRSTMFIMDRKREDMAKKMWEDYMRYNYIIE